MKLISSKEEVFIEGYQELNNGIYERILLVDNRVIWYFKKDGSLYKDRNTNQRCHELFDLLEKQYNEALKEMDFEEVKMYLKKQ